MINEILVYNSKTYEQTDKVPIALRASVTREDNEIIQMTKSDDDKYLAVMTGKFLLNSSQAVNNQLYIFVLK